MRPHQVLQEEIMRGSENTKEVEPGIFFEMNVGDSAQRCDGEACVRIQIKAERST